MSLGKLWVTILYFADWREWGKITLWWGKSRFRGTTDLWLQLESYLTIEDLIVGLSVYLSIDIYCWLIGRPPWKYWLYACWIFLNSLFEDIGLYCDKNKDGLLITWIFCIKIYNVGSMPFYTEIEINKNLSCHPQIRYRSYYWGTKKKTSILESC